MVLRVALKDNSQEGVICSTSRFEELFDVHYLSHLVFDNWTIEQWVRKKCTRALGRGNIGQLAKWLGTYHAKEIEEATAPDVTIRWIGPQIGYGLFTDAPLKKWAFVGEYTGVLRKRNLFFRNVNDYCFMYPREWYTLKPLTIDSALHGNYTRFINHSDTPNCESVSVLHDGVFHIIFRTIEEIPQGTELTYDYGDIYWYRRKKLPRSA